MPAKWADQLWLIVKTEQPPASLEDAAKNENPAPKAQAIEDPEMQQILGDDQPPAAEKENQHTAAVLLPPELITKALLLDYLASLFPSDASEAALTLAMTRLTSTELLRFYKNFVKSASDLHSEVNQFLMPIRKVYVPVWDWRERMPLVL